MRHPDVFPPLQERLECGALAVGARLLGAQHYKGYSRWSFFRGRRRAFGRLARLHPDVRLFGGLVDVPAALCRFSSMVWYHIIGLSMDWRLRAGGWRLLGPGSCWGRRAESTAPIHIRSEASQGLLSQQANAFDNRNSPSRSTCSWSRGCSCRPRCCVLSMV